VLFRSQK